MKSNREEREQLLREMAAAYRQFRRLERSLNRPPLNRLTGTALRFAASLVQPQRCPKRMKNQQTFAATMPGAVAGPGAQPEEACIAGSGRDS